MAIPKDFLTKYNNYFKDKLGFDDKRVIDSVYDIVTFYNKIAPKDRVSAELLIDSNKFVDKKKDYSVEDIVFNRLAKNVNAIINDSHFLILANLRDCEIANFNPVKKIITIDYKKDDESIKKFVNHLKPGTEIDKETAEKLTRSSLVHELLHACSYFGRASYGYAGYKENALNEFVTEDIAMNVLGFDDMFCAYGYNEKAENPKNKYIIYSNSRSGYAWGIGVSRLLSAFPNSNFYVNYLYNQMAFNNNYDKVVENENSNTGLRKYLYADSYDSYFNGLRTKIEKLFQNERSGKDKRLYLEEIIQIQASLLEIYYASRIGDFSIECLEKFDTQEHAKILKEIEGFKKNFIIKVPKIKDPSDLFFRQTAVIRGVSPYNILDRDAESLKALTEQNILVKTPNVYTLIEIKTTMQDLENVKLHTKLHKIGESNKKTKSENLVNFEKGNENTK